MAEMAMTTGGVLVGWASEHRDKEGNLIVRQTSIEPPPAPTCFMPGCMARYLKAALFYALLAMYEERRTAYAEAKRHEVILERYRTGQPMPKNIWQAVHALLKIKCPVCRKFNVDPLLFRRNS